MERSAVNKNLLEIFKNVNDWLKFAEAKNAMLIGLNGAILVGISQINNHSFFNFNPFFWNGYISIIQILLMFSMVISILSFVPKLHMKVGFYTSSEVKNLWFFESLKSMTNDQILEQIANTDTKKANKVDKDLAEQIKQISIIASSKYLLFTVAVWFLISSLISIPVAVLFALYLYLK